MTSARTGWYDSFSHHPVDDVLVQFSPSPPDPRRIQRSWSNRPLSPSLQDVSTTLNVAEGNPQTKLEQKGGAPVELGELDRICLMTANYLEPCRSSSGHKWEQKDIDALVNGRWEWKPPHARPMCVPTYPRPGRACLCERRQAAARTDRLSARAKPPLAQAGSSRERRLATVPETYYPTPPSSSCSLATVGAEKLNAPFHGRPFVSAPIPPQSHPHHSPATIFPQGLQIFGRLARHQTGETDPGRLRRLRREHVEVPVRQMLVRVHVLVHGGEGQKKGGA